MLGFCPLNACTPKSMRARHRITVHARESHSHVDSGSRFFFGPPRIPEMTAVLGVKKSEAHGNRPRHGMFDWTERVKKSRRLCMIPPNIRGHLEERRREKNDTWDMFSELFGPLLNKKKRWPSAERTYSAHMPVGAMRCERSTQML